jgi:hypothetical protein
MSDWDRTQGGDAETRPAYGQPAYGQPAYGQPAYGQPAYGQPAYGQVPHQYGYGYGYGFPAPRNDGLAVASMVTSIAGIVLAFCCAVFVAGCIAGIIMGAISRKRIRESNGMLTGDGMALAGIIVGAVGTALYVAFFVIYIALLGGSMMLGGTSS